ncbi:hypothetical protein [Micromonospora sp. NPDC048830]|uniref:hypothetical protein n=1 Tax=Micromonospora sp. NPDC048830 TaxID=3364257 RepID=UPI0037180637
MSQPPVPDRPAPGSWYPGEFGQTTSWDPAVPERTDGSAPQPAAGPGPYAGLPTYPSHPGPVPPGHPPGAAHWPPPGYDPADPLVTPPGQGLSGWFSRCAGVVRRGWRQLTPILLLTHALPTLALLLAVVPLYPVLPLEPTAPGAPPAALPDGYLGDLGVFFAALLGLSCLLALVQAVGWAAGTWVVARQAAGEPVPVGAALRYGLRRAPALWGWTLVYGLLAAVGLVLCYLPGLYVMAALSLFGPVLLFERGAPLGRAREMFHARLGAVLGRIALVGLAASVFSLVLAPVQVAGALLGDPADAASFSGWNVAYAVVAAVITLPYGLVHLVGLIVTYAEQRACEAPVTAARLAGELG